MAEAGKGLCQVPLVPERYRSGYLGRGVRQSGEDFPVPWLATLSYKKPSRKTHVTIRKDEMTRVVHLIKVRVSQHSNLFRRLEVGNDSSKPLVFINLISLIEASCPPGRVRMDPGTCQDAEAVA